MMQDQAQPLEWRLRVERKPMGWLLVGHSRMTGGGYRQNGVCELLPLDVEASTLGQVAIDVASQTADDVTRETLVVPPAMKFLGFEKRSAYMRGSKMLFVRWADDHGSVRVAPSRKVRGEFEGIGKDTWIVSSPDSTSLGEALLEGINRCV